MDEFLSVSLSYPTVIFTALLAASFLYWILVIVGALGIDALDFDFDGAADGLADGVAEGAAEGAGEGAAEGPAGSSPVGTHEGVAERGLGGRTGGSGERGAGLLASIFYALKLRAVPVTLVLSLVILIGWVLCWLGYRYLVLGMGLGPEWLIGTALLASAIIVAFPITAAFVRPLAAVLKVEKAVSRRDLVGKVVRIDTSRVDRRFGMAKAEDGGAGLLVQVRCDADDNGLGRGSNALVVAYDDKREVYEVVPFEDLPPLPPRFGEPGRH
jgi:hypothetical protein